MNKEKLIIKSINESYEAGFIAALESFELAISVLNNINEVRTCLREIIQTLKAKSGKGNE